MCCIHTYSLPLSLVTPPQQLKAKLSEYDEHYKVSETATSFLQAGIDRAHKSVDEVRLCDVEDSILSAKEVC